MCSVPGEKDVFATLTTGIGASVNYESHTNLNAVFQTQYAA